LRRRGGDGAGDQVPARRGTSGVVPSRGGAGEGGESGRSEGEGMTKRPAGCPRQAWWHLSRAARRDSARPPSFWVLRSGAWVPDEMISIEDYMAAIWKEEATDG